MASQSRTVEGKGQPTPLVLVGDDDALRKALALVLRTLGAVTATVGPSPEMIGLLAVATDSRDRR